MQLLSADSAGALKVWDPEGGTCLQTHDAHEARLWALAPSPDGRSFVTGAEDGALITWGDVTEQVGVGRRGCGDVVTWWYCDQLNIHCDLWQMVWWNCSMYQGSMAIWWHGSMVLG